MITTADVIDRHARRPLQRLAYYPTFHDLDTSRQINWPDELPAPGKAKADSVAAWEVGEGFDLQGTEYRPPGSDRSYYALRALGLRAWPIANNRLTMIEAQLRTGQAPELGRQAGDLLMDLDPQTGTEDPRGNNFYNDYGVPDADATPDIYTLLRFLRFRLFNRGQTSGTHDSPIVTGSPVRSCTMQTSLEQNETKS